MMSGERELRGQAREKKAGEIEEKGWGEVAGDKGYAEMKGEAKGRKKTESRMAKHGCRKQECKNER